MRRLDYFMLTIVLSGFLLFLVLSDAHGSSVYTLTVAGERLEFVPAPASGYVVKVAQEKSQIGIFAATMFLEAGQIKPIHGLGRRGIYVVENAGPAGQNEKTIKTLRADRQIEYAAPLFSSNGETVAVIPEIVIRVSPGVDERQVHFLCQSMALAVIKPMEFTTQEYLLQVLGPDAEAVFTAVEHLNKVDWLEWAAPNTAFQPKLFDQDIPASSDSGPQFRLSDAAQDANSPGVFPNDEYFPMQWHLHNTGQSSGTPGADINAPRAWEITTGDPNIVVAVIDTGVDPNHPDLISNLVAGYDFYEDDNEPDPAFDHYGNAHGTACAGLISAQGNNGIGVSGVTWNCKIMPIRIFGVGADGTGYNCTEADVATAFRWAASNGAEVFSNSWDWSQNPTIIIYSAILDITKEHGIGRGGKGCVVLFAAANESGPITWYPEKYPEVITVGATDHNDQRCWYSNYGPELDITSTSGGGIVVKSLYEWEYFEEYMRQSKHLLWTTDLHGDAGYSIFNENSDLLDYTEKMCGTSGATPVAAGVAALILSVEPNLTSDEVRHFLERSAKDLGDPGRDDYYGWGRVDARAALDMVLAKRADLNNDWKVDEQDLAILNAAIDTNDLSADIAPAAKRDGKVDQQDLDLLMRYLGKVIPELGLIAHWKLDEGEGEVAHNSTGDPKYNADLHGGPLWQPTGGMVDGALMLDGTDDYVSTPFVLNPAAGSFSIFAWVKGGAPGQVVISQKGGANWLLADPSKGKLMTSLSAPAGRTPPQPLTSDFVITDGNWHRVGLTWDGSNRILYLDDVEAAKDTQASLAGSTGGLYIGAGKGLESGKFWSGLIDEVRIYERAVRP